QPGLQDVPGLQGGEGAAAGTHGGGRAERDQQGVHRSHPGGALVSLPKPAPDADVVVTGASSGIGTEIARGLAQRGHNLVLVARRKERMEALASELRTAHDVRITIHARDLGSSDERDALVSDLRGSARTVTGICNCAGFGTSGKFKDLPLRREREQ